MNNIYGNNQRMYGNQYQPNQNIYQGPNYIPPSRGNAGNIYSPGNFNQPNNYNQNQNQMNTGPKAFITGHIGRLQIASEDLETFSKSLKSAEWTNNANYLQAKNIEVKMKISLQGQLQSNVNIPKNRFNDYNINSNFNYDEYQNFIKTVENQNKKVKEDSNKEKNEFLRVNFPNEKPDISNENIFKKIGENKKTIIEKDSNLYRKVERLIPLLNRGNSNSEPSSGIYDVTRANSDGKVFTNNNYGTPGVAY